MKIEKNTVVRFHYDLFEQANDEHIETSRDADPMAFLFGYRNILRHLEEAMSGHEKGDRITAELTARQAYGERKAHAEQRVPIKHLVIDKKIKPAKGMTVTVQTDQGQKQATVVKAGKFTVDLDMNHPLAGKDLRFVVDIVDVRQGTPEEIAHGHAHGIGGHQH